jgi:hypothetical protein
MVRASKSGAICSIRKLNNINPSANEIINRKFGIAIPSAALLVVRFGPLLYGARKRVIKKGR